MRIHVGRFFSYYKHDCGLWFRVFNRGFSIVDRTKQRAPFSVRSGHVKEWRIGKWGIKCLS